MDSQRPFFSFIEGVNNCWWRRILLDKLQREHILRLRRAACRLCRGFQGYGFHELSPVLGVGFWMAQLLYLSQPCSVIHISVSDPSKNSLVQVHKVELRCDHDFGLPLVLFLRWVEMPVLCLPRKRPSCNTTVRPSFSLSISVENDGGPARVMHGLDVAATYI